MVLKERNLPTAYEENVIVFAGALQYLDYIMCRNTLDCCNLTYLGPKVAVLVAGQSVMRTLLLCLAGIHSATARRVAIPVVSHNPFKVAVLLLICPGTSALF